MGNAGGAHMYTDPNNFEHITGLHAEEAFEIGNLGKLQCPKWDVCNALSNREESIVDRDLTVLKDPHSDGTWLFQFRKFKVACAFAPEISDFPFDSQSIKLELTLREELGRRFTEIEGLPSVVFHRDMQLVTKQYSFEMMQDDTVGFNPNRGQ